MTLFSNEHQAKNALKVSFVGCLLALILLFFGQVFPSSVLLLSSLAIMILAMRRIPNLQSYIFTILKKYMRPLCFICILCSLLACQNDSTEQPKPANVIIILTDDQGYGDVGIHGNDSLLTPNQDFLAAQGIRMDNFYVSPVCAPTRASFIDRTVSLSDRN